MLSIFNKLLCLIICTIFASNLTLAMQTQQPKSRKIVVKFHGTTFPITPEVLSTTKMLNEFVEECNDDEKEEKGKKSTLEIDITSKCPHTLEQFRLFLTIAQHCAFDQNYGRYFSLWPKKAGAILDLANRFDNQQVLECICKKLVDQINNKDLVNFLYNKGPLPELLRTTPNDIQNFILKKLLLKKYSDLETELIEKNTKDLKGHSDYVNCLIQLNDGTLASGSSDHTIKIWDLNKPITLKTLTGHSKQVNCLLQLKDGTLASGSEDNTIRIWDLNKSNATKTLRGHSNRVNCLVQLNDSTFASGSIDRTIKIWDLKQSEAIKTLIGHSDWVNCLIQLKNGTLASGSSDHTIKIWDLNKPIILKTLTGHSDWLRCLTQLNDGTLASGSTDRTIKIWPLNIVKTVTFEELLFIFAVQKIVMQQKQKLAFAKKEFSYAKKIYAKLPQDVKNTVKSYVTK